MNKTLINVALAVAFGSAALSAQAAVLNTGDSLSMFQGVVAYSTVNLTDDNGNVTGTKQVQSNVTKSWFGMDTDGDAAIAGTEKVVVTQGTNGIVIGAVTTAGPFHTGASLPGETGAVTAAWDFFGHTGSNYNTVAITGGTSGLNFSGWNVSWAGLAAIPMTGGAWGSTTLNGAFVNGVAQLTWDGIYGNTYKLDYTATVPMGDPSNFGGVKYKLHLEGVVTAAPVSQVPVPAAAWLLGSGLLGLVGVARRKQQA